MEDYRSKSYGVGRNQVASYYGPPPISSNIHDFRSYSTSYASSYADPQMGKDLKKFKKGKSTKGSSSKSWSFIDDPEFQRKKRVATYKAYAVEGKMKGSLSKSFRWLKDRYTRVVYGWW